MIFKAHQGPRSRGQFPTRPHWTKTRDVLQQSKKNLDPAVRFFNFCRYFGRVLILSFLSFSGDSVHDNIFTGYSCWQGLLRFVTNLIPRRHLRASWERFWESFEASLRSVTGDGLGWRTGVSVQRNFIGLLSLYVHPRLYPGLFLKTSLQVFFFVFTGMMKACVVGVVC